MDRRPSGLATLMPDDIAKTYTTLHEAGAKKQMAQFGSIFRQWSKYKAALRNRDIANNEGAKARAAYHHSSAGGSKNGYTSKVSATRKAMVEKWWNDPIFKGHEAEVMILIDYLYQDQTIIERAGGPSAKLKRAYEDRMIEDAQKAIVAAEFEGVPPGAGWVEDQLMDANGRTIATRDTEGNVQSIDQITLSP